MTAAAVRALGLALATCLSLAGAVHYVNLTFDDAFVSFRYAENLAHGRGLVFNPGERVEGYSNPTFTLLLALPALLGVSRFELGLLWTAKSITLACALGTLWVIARAAPRATGSTWGAWPLGAILLATSMVHLMWSVGALEGPLLGLLLVLCATQWLHEVERAPVPSRFDWSALWLALAALTRPEPVVLVAPLLALRVAFWPTRDGRARRAHVRYLLTFAAPYLAYLAFRLAYYGKPLPNTYYAKLHDDGLALGRGLSYATEALAETNALTIALVCTLLALVARQGRLRALLILALLGTQVSAIVYEGGDWMSGWRLLAPSLPLLALLVDTGWAAAVRLELGHLALPPLPAWVVNRAWVERWNAQLRNAPRHARALLRGVSCAALVVGVAVGSLRSFQRWKGAEGSGFGGIRPGQGALFDVARWMSKHCERDALLATGEAGIVPFYTGMRLLDLHGLMDPYVANLPGSRHRKFDLHYVLGKRPKYAFLLATRLPDGSLTSTALYSRELLASPEFHAQYRVLQQFPHSVVYGRRSP
jgi:hypothetical protein